MTDAGGAVLPNATVKVTNVETAQEASVSTNDVGGYTLSSLAPGTYDISVQSPGFRTLTRRGVSISANTLRREDVTLELGQVNESVTVNAGVVALQTDTADVHSELSSRDVINMPLPKYRNYQTLVNLVPGARPGSIRIPCRPLGPGSVHQRQRRESQQQCTRLTAR